MGQTHMSAWSWMMVMKRDERTWQLRFNDGHEARRTPMAAWKKSDWTVTAGPSTIVLERTYGMNHMDHGIFPSKRYINQIYAFVLFLHWASTRSMGESTPHYHTRSGPLPLLHLTMSLTIKVPSSRTSFPRRRPWQSRLPPPPPPSPMSPFRRRRHELPPSNTPPLKIAAFEGCCCLCCRHWPPSANK
jgi:hypothetical protein